MIANRMREEVEKNSTVRKMFEEGRRLAKIYGEDKVYDFSLGNPNVPAPKEINEEIIRIVSEENSLKTHGYMSNAGFEEVRSIVADSLNKRFGTDFTDKNIIMTVGAAGALHVIFKTLLDPEDEVILFAPYFMEYRAYIRNYHANQVVISPNTTNFQPNMIEFEEKITKKTKVVLVNSPNNPTGAVYTEDTYNKMAEILKRKQQEFGTTIYLISDEPYRELVYDGIEAPFITKYYENAIVAYSFSKSISLPGERIGYLVIPKEVSAYEEIFYAASIAVRILGFMNAPSLMQKVIGRCIDAKVDIEAYNRNRKLLFDSLTEYGFTCVKPEGTFYLFVKTPIEDDVEFCNKAKEKNILIVPGSSFTCPGYARISYCVAYDTIKNALPVFRELADEFIKR